MIVSALNNKLGHGRVEIVVLDDGNLGYKLDGADPVPFFKILASQTAVKVENSTISVVKDAYYAFVDYDIKSPGENTYKLPDISGGIVVSGGFDNYIEMATITHSSGSTYNHGIAIYIIQSTSTTLQFSGMKRPGILLRIM